MNRVESGRAERSRRMEKSLRAGIAVIAWAGFGCASPAEEEMTLPLGGGGTGAAGMAVAGTGAAGMSVAGMGGETGGIGAGAGAGAGAGGSAGAGAGGSAGAGAGAGAGGMSAGAGGMAGTGGMSAGTGGMDMGHMPACIADPSQLVIVGDSYIQWVSHQFPTDLAELGDAVGTWNVAPPVGTMYAVGGTSLGTGQIPGQATSALAEKDDVKVVIMDGGGNDILLNPLGQGCKSTGSSTMQICKDIVDGTLEAAKGMQAGLIAEGVTDLVYFFYPHVPLNTALGGPNPNEILDYALPLAKAYCDGVLADTGGAVKCHFVDMIPVFEGHTDYFAPVDIHPNNTGSAAMAAEVWRVMEENCVAQPESSGCCVP